MLVALVLNEDQLVIIIFERVRLSEAWAVFGASLAGSHGNPLHYPA